MMLESSSRSDTVYDRLNNLAAEISEGIINLSEEQREQVQRELSALREQAYKERSPEAVYNTLLFRKYAAIANQIKDDKRGRGDKTTLIGELPSFVYEQDDENMMVGWEAVKTNIFRLRALATMFALITFSVMSSAPYITESTFYPGHHFHSGCEYAHKFQGEFNFRAYELVIAVGVLAFLHNAAHMWYYWLPVDSNRQKYVPGGTGLLAICFRAPNQAEEHSNTLGVFCRRHSKFMEVAFDGVLLLLALIAFVVSQILLESGVKTHVTDAYGHTTEQYYTLSTCYATYSDETPACLDKGLDPTSRIRAGLAMLFFCTVFLVLNFLVSLRAFRQDPNAGMFSFALGFGGSSSGASGGGLADQEEGAVMAPGSMRILVSSEEAQAADADYAKGSRV